LLAAIFAFVPVYEVSARAQVPPVSPSRVLVVLNTRSPDSAAIASYYVKKRHVPPANVCRIACPTTEECARQEYLEQIQKPVQQFLAGGKRDMDFILLTKGIPIRMKEGGFATDSILATMGDVKPMSRNPYFGSNERFSHAKSGFYLVTRLDGYTRADCLRLVDNALAAKPLSGPFLLHTGPGHDGEGYRDVNEAMRRAGDLLKAKKMRCVLSAGDTFPGGYTGLMGYFSWGSNDKNYDRKAYHSLRFAPGGLAETAVSYSGRTFTDPADRTGFNYPNGQPQSLIADLIAQGVTGCKGYVSEPYVDAIARADILFDRYTSGYTLAESFYMASQILSWKDVVIGDPLCAPYAAR
jgi:uncharacterized protein (TIGR03790 family)